MKLPAKFLCLSQCCGARLWKPASWSRLTIAVWIVLRAACPALAQDALPDDFLALVRNSLFDAKTVAAGEDLAATLLVRYTNYPAAIGKIHQALANRHSYEMQKDLDQLIRHCETALACPLQFFDACNCWELLGNAFVMKMGDAKPRESHTFRRKGLAAYLNGLKLARLKAESLRNPNVKAPGPIDSYSEQDVKRHVEFSTAWFKDAIARMYQNLPFVNEIAVEGEKIIADAGLLQEIIDGIKKLGPEATLAPGLEKASVPPPDTVLLTATEYEVEGRIEQLLLEPGPSSVKANFKVFVKHGGWLIETIDIERSEGKLLTLQIGSANGTEIFASDNSFEAMTVQRPKGTNASASAGTQAVAPPLFSTVMSNTVPAPIAGRADWLAGHLWLMFASHAYFKNISTNRLPPIYDSICGIEDDPEFKFEADWDLMQGAAPLPLKVVYYNPGGIYRRAGKGAREREFVPLGGAYHAGFVSAIYCVTGFTNFGKSTFPSGFTFDEFQFGRGRSRYDLRLRKHANVVVTAFRPEVTRKTLLPTLAGKKHVMDYRLLSAHPSGKKLEYLEKKGDRWVAVDEAKRISEGKGLTKLGRYMVVLWIAVLFVPVITLGVLHIVKRQKRQPQKLMRH